MSGESPGQVERGETQRLCAAAAPPNILALPATQTPADFADFVGTRIALRQHPYADAPSSCQ